MSDELHAKVYGDAVHVDLWYPRNATSPIKAVHVGLEDVRAADDVRITYDYDRDGWSIAQASRFAWGGTGECDADWQEVAFVPAWGRRETEEEETARITKEQAP